MAINYDSIILKNQPVAREGRLPYRSADGRILWKLKRWKDLKRNIGRRVPVINEHPATDNGRGGLFNGLKRIEGWAVLKQYKNYKMLAADMELLDDCAEKNGFSCGYPYIPLVPGPEETVFDGGPVDEVQANMLIDHIALTDEPREPTAIQSAWDAISGQSTTEVPGVWQANVHQAVDSQKYTEIDQKSGKIEQNFDTVVPIYAIAYDSIRCIVDLDSVKTREMIEQKLRESNPGIATDKLARLVEIQFQNQFIHENMRHLFKTEGDGTTMPEDEKKKKKKLGMSDKLKESDNPDDANKEGTKKDQMGMDAVSKSIDELKSMLSKTAQDTDDRFDKVMDIVTGLSTVVGDMQAKDAADVATKAVQDTVKQLRARGFTDADLDGKDQSYLEGMLSGVKTVALNRTRMAKARDSNPSTWGITRHANGRVSYGAHNQLVYHAATDSFDLPEHVKKQLQGGSA